MNLFTWISLIAYAYVIILQIINWKNKSDGNGQDKVRFNFIVNIVLLVLITACIELKYEHFAEFMMTVLAFCCIAFYHHFDLRKPYLWIKKMFSK